MKNTQDLITEEHTKYIIIKTSHVCKDRICTQSKMSTYIFKVTQITADLRKSSKQNNFK